MIVIFINVLLISLFLGIFQQYYNKSIHTNNNALFNASQILFLNLTIDELISYALSQVKYFFNIFYFIKHIFFQIEPSGYMLYAQPISTREYVLNPIMIKNIVLQSIFQISILIYLLFQKPQNQLGYNAYFTFDLFFPVFLYF